MGKILDDIRPLRKIAANKARLNDAVGQGMAVTNTITAFNAPESYQAQFKAANGYEWSTYGLYDGENRRRGAEVSFFTIKPKLPADSTAKKTDSLPTEQLAVVAPPQGGGGRGGGRFGQGGGAGGSRGDSATVKIYNVSNELIRTLKWNVDSGFNRQYWGMEEKGVRQPGTPKPLPGAAEPGGLQVLPGTYKLVITYARASDSTLVTIKDDPRLGNRNDIKLAQRKMYDRLKKSADKLTEGMDRLTEADEVCTKMQSQLKGLEGKDADSLRKATTKMTDSIKSIREMISGKTSDKQGISRSPFEVTTMTQLQSAQQSIGSKMVAPGAQEEIMMVNAEKAVVDALQKINAFFDGKWKDYRQQVEGTKVNLFKDYKPIQ
jgi:hypothetical protein